MSQTAGTSVRTGSSARRLALLDQSPLVRWIAMGGLVVLGLWCLGALADSYFEYAFEADSAPTVVAAEAFGEAWSRPLPPPFLPLPYFDAQYWIYALGYLAAKAAKALGMLDQARFPTPQSLAVLAVRYVNLAAQVGAVALAFHAAARLSGSTLLASLLGLVFLFDPQLLAIDLMRIDRVILFLFLLVFALSVEVIRGRRSALLDAFLGISAAALVMTKITSVVFLVIPVFAYLHQRVAFKASPRHAAAFLAVFVAAALLMNTRYFVNEWPDTELIRNNMMKKLDSVRSWGAILSRKPYLYYNWDAFAPLGAAFMAVFLVALPASAWGAVHRRHAEAGLVLLTLLVLTVLGIPAFKYSRGGYILVPLYLYVIAHGALYIQEELAGRIPRARSWAWIAGAMIGVALLPALYKGWVVYERVRVEASTRAESIRITRVAPREWFVRNVPAGARVAILTDSEWADPPIFDLGYDFSPRFLKFPYLDPAAMGKFGPPDLETLPNAADVIVLNNYHRSVYPQMMKTFGHAPLALEWAKFFDELIRRYPHHQFEASHANYGVDRVDIVVLNARAHPSPVVRYRLNNPATGDYLYTTDANEYAVLAQCCGWRPEGAVHRVFGAPGSYEGVPTIPLYRLFAASRNRHYWTTDANEYVTMPAQGWKQEGIDGYVLPAPVAGAIPLYRLHHPGAGARVWTTDNNERRTLIAGQGWTDEGVTGYVLPSP